MKFYSPRAVEPTSIESLIDFIKHNISKDRLLCETQGLVEQLMGVQHNTANILEHISASLSKTDNNPNTNPYGKNSFILYRDSTVMLRLVVWEPRAGEDFTRTDEELFAYGVCHDHNFELMSLGLCGNGYTTHMYSYQHKGSEYAEGELIDIDYQGDFTLQQGSVLYMEQSKDLHTQSPPAQMSMSLNIIVDHGIKKKQVFVEPKTKRIVEYRGLVNPKSYIQSIHKKLTEPKLEANQCGK
ncbi:hypothetical protein [Thalassomonas actiniarum]|uniref:Uncharacterized protein n=1 Tax=Thalassomonas actiniarum TaxID=485447 RepID=A0AAE9YYY7_9GAMM|nr:hypothetical protein [Thalassomonas actiniarum]WDE02108.1 hypothetical protein SG35_030560 [Thalassomonas actiniarum]